MTIIAIIPHYLGEMLLFFGIVNVFQNYVVKLCELQIAGD